MGRWSRGMILPSGGRGRGFDSRTAPFPFLFDTRTFFVTTTCDVAASVVHVPVAQLDKASDYESEDWGFKSLQGY